MRINLLRIRKHWSRFWLIFFRNILWSIQKLFLEMLPLIPLKSTNPFLKISVFKELLFLWKQSFLLRGSIILSMETVSPAVLMIHLSWWGVKEANPICEANFLPWNLYVQKWNGCTTRIPESLSVNAIVKIHVQVLPVVEWFISIRKRTYAPIQV